MLPNRDVRRKRFFGGERESAALSSASGTGEFIVGPKRVHVENCINGKMKLLYKRSFIARVEGGMFSTLGEKLRNIFFAT